MVEATFEGTFGHFTQHLLVYTGATLSLLCIRRTPKLKDLPVRAVKILEGYKGKEKAVPFTDPLMFTMGTIDDKNTRLQALDGNGIL